MEDQGPDSGLPFMKMHGLGNDFVVIDRRGGGAVVTPVLARALGDRHRGVGFDQLAVIEAAGNADARLTFFNSDGSPAEACGNATRCVARHLMGETGASSLTILTERGLLQAVDAGEGLTSVNMGQPVDDWRLIPLAEGADLDALPIAGSPSAVGMGNPHCIFFVADAEAVDVAGQGAAIEHHPMFPEATNVEFVQVRAPHEVRMRVWERGTGITLACGSGACAAAVAAARRGLTGRTIRMELDGGWMTLDWRDDGVWMTGPTAHVFSGVLTPAFLAGL
jgi:diaminopimelate epimerase